MTDTISREGFLAAVSFDANGLVPTIAQDAGSGDVLMTGPVATVYAGEWPDA